MKNIFILLWLTCIRFDLFSQQIWHVKSDAAGENSGLNWQDAFTDLQSALQIAQYGDDIWVAAGTHTPTQGDDRTISFDIPIGVRLAGGFAGTETLFGQRDLNTYQTILSGDIGVPGIWEDNSYHVVQVYGGDTLTVLDGFKIMHGRSGTFNDPTPHAYGGGLLVWADELRPVSVPVIQNCIFEQNYATSGGGMACVSRYQEYTSAPTVRNCTFSYNKGEIEGGSFCKVGKCLPNRPFIIANCTFTQNYCAQLGGAAAITETVGEVRLVNCTFLSDTVQFEAGAMYLKSNGKAQYLLDSCTFSLNYARNGGGGAITYTQNGDTAILHVRNSFFTSNRVRLNNGAAIVSASLGAPGGQHVLQIEKTRFENNISQAGGCVYVVGNGNSDMRIDIDRCLFLKNLYSNSSTAAGGAFFFRGTNTTSFRNYTRVTNSVFAYNDGAFVTLALEPSILETDIVNCTFLNNGLVPFLKYWTPEFNDTSYYQKMTILNSLIWEEESPGPYRLFYNNDPDNFNVNDYTVEHCLLNLPTCEYEGVDPCGEGMFYETPPQFVSTDPAMPELSLTPGSPAINRGSNTVADTFGLQYDYSGNARILQDTVDIGAFESDSVVSGISTPFFEQESFLLQVHPNVLATGESIQAGLLNLGGKKTFTFRLHSADGLEKYSQEVKNAPPQIPVTQAIPTEHLAPGFYFLSVTDGLGRRKTQKVVVNR